MQDVNVTPASVKNVGKHSGAPVVERNPMNVSVGVKASFLAEAFKDAWQCTPARINVRDEGKHSFTSVHITIVKQLALLRKPRDPNNAEKPTQNSRWRKAFVCN